MMMWNNSICLKYRNSHFFIINKFPFRFNKAEGKNPGISKVSLHKQDIFFITYHPPGFQLFTYWRNCFWDIGIYLQKFLLHSQQFSLNFFPRGYFSLMITQRNRNLLKSLFLERNFCYSRIEEWLMFYNDAYSLVVFQLGIEIHQYFSVLDCIAKIIRETAQFHSLFQVFPDL